MLLRHNEGRIRQCFWRREPQHERRLMKVAAIIAAGGVGARLQSKVHKPFILLAGRPMIVWTVGLFEKTPSVDEIIVSIHPDDIVRFWTLAQQYRLGKVRAVVAGGRSRMASVANGLRAVSQTVRWVLVHDAARPLAAPALVESTIHAARSSGAAIAAVPVVPTIKEARGLWVTKTLDRKNLWAVQTPQVFRRDLLERAHRNGLTRKIDATDDAALVESLGHRVRLVPGSPRNIKVTTPEDVVIAQALLKNVDR